MHCKPIQIKGSKNKKQLRTANAPVPVVSTDQLVIPTLDLIPTHRGRSTIQRYVGATVFVDYSSNFTYIHLMEKLDGESAVIEKYTFERVYKSYLVTVHKYHSDEWSF